MIEFLSNKDNWALIIAVVIVLVIIYLQWKSFKSTKAVIDQLANFFPNTDALKVRQFQISSQTISSDESLKKFLAHPASEEVDEYADNIVNVSIIVPTAEINSLFYEFGETGFNRSISIPGIHRKIWGELKKLCDM